MKSHFSYQIRGHAILTPLTTVCNCYSNPSAPRLPPPSHPAYTPVIRYAARAADIISISSRRVKSVDTKRPNRELTIGRTMARRDPRNDTTYTLSARLPVQCSAGRDTRAFVRRRSPMISVIKCVEAQRREGVIPKENDGRFEERPEESLGNFRVCERHQVNWHECTLDFWGRRHVFIRELESSKRHTVSARRQSFTAIKREQAVKRDVPVPRVASRRAESRGKDRK